MKNNFVPDDSKYIPLTQQKWLCTPTCIQMVMLRHSIPLVPAELIANMMGLIVPEDGLKYFWNSKTGPKPPAGYGTQAGKPQYGPNAVFKKLEIPLKMTWSLINKFKTKEQFYQYFTDLEKKDIDILVCFDWGTLFDKDFHSGHLCVLDKVDLKNKEVRIIDPEYDAPKWRVVKIDKLFEAMKYHGKDKSAGFWELSLKNRSEFVAPNDPVLIKIAEEISQDQFNSSEVKNVIEKMLDAAYGHQKDRTKAVLVGLAAPQIGISKRIILVDVVADGKGNVGDLRVYINPEVFKQSQEKEDWYEGCWSTSHVTGIVSRPKTVQIRAYTPDGKEVTEFHHGYTARIFQHEIDHLNGKEFVTHITDDNNLHWVDDDQWVEYRNSEAWRNWPHKCPRDKWNKIKGITS